MSEARALTNFSGNAIATLLIGKWTSTVDLAQTQRVLDKQDPFDEATMVDDHVAEETADAKAVAAH
jgi:aerobic C4-dicarboxylate transport protein